MYVCMYVLFACYVFIVIIMILLVNININITNYYH